LVVPMKAALGPLIVVPLVYLVVAIQLYVVVLCKAASVSRYCQLVPCVPWFTVSPEVMLRATQVPLGYVGQLVSDAHCAR
jgi:hypothetical protein